jgi:hypothetical protein
MTIKKNLGIVDRAVRIVIGVLLILISTLAFVGPSNPLAYLGLLGIVPLIAGITGFCPPYHWLRINTYKRKSTVATSMREVSNVR